MNAMVPAHSCLPAEIAPSVDKLVALSAGLAPSRYAANGDDPGLVIRAQGRPPTPNEIELASLILPLIEEAMKPPEYAVARAWLIALNASVSVPLDKRAFAVRFAAIADALSDFPAFAWSEAARKAACNEFEFFPGARKLREFLKPYAAPALELAAAVRRIANWDQSRTARRGSRSMEALVDGVVSGCDAPEPEITIEQREAFIADTYRKHGLDPTKFSRRRSPTDGDE
jgi:hypothetical protein